MGLRSSVLTALRVGPPINGFRNRKWAHMHRIILCYIIFCLISLCVAFISSFILHLYSVSSVSILITSVLNSASDRLAISSFFFWSFDFFFHLGHISLPWCTCYIVRGRALGIHQGGATQVAVLWLCMWRRDPRGNNATC